MKISDIQVKDKKPFRAWYRGSLIWWKYHERTQAVFDYASQQGYTLPSNSIAFDNAIRLLHKNGIFDISDVFLSFVGDGDINFRLINLVNPDASSATSYGGLEWSNQGILGNGINGYIDTGFNPALLAQGQKWQLNNASQSLVQWLQRVGSSGINQILAGSNLSHSNIIQSSTAAIQRINSLQNLNEEIIFNTIGFKSVIRQDANNILLVNKELSFNRTQNVGTIPNGNHCILFRPDGFGVNGLSTFFMGAAITFEQSQIFRAIFNDYLTALGLEPIA